MKNSPIYRAATRRTARIAAILAGLVALLTAQGGCSSVSYYAQAAQGQFSLLYAARPISDWLDDPAAPDTLKTRLRRAQSMRAFASAELALPDNRSYKLYADLQRPAVVWNVFATPELSLQLKTWCYPFFGCAGYRGYFDRAAADAMAAELRSQKYDVNVAPVPAYSTLGWFDDPLLNTFIHYGDADLARLIFHELGHQLIYVRDDTRFNESFATAVERVGVRRWLKKHADEATLAAYERFEQRRADFVQMLRNYRDKLAAVLAGNEDEDIKRERKRAVFAALQAEYRRAKEERWEGWAGYDRFFAQDLNNAHLAAIGTYNDLVPAFEMMLQDQQSDLPRFYSEVRRLAALPKPQRDGALAAAAAAAHASAIAVIPAASAGAAVSSPGPTLAAPAR
ncbi:MAG TPA: aminopeptidase [Burkholderiaceae bacterium]|nr:aminopeptidase [Burkholderiaceae bacterium]